MQGVGPGASLLLWVNYFDFLDVHFMEYDRPCADKWRGSATIHVGDQGNPLDLYRLINESGGNFDLIVDDGGHLWSQQQASLDILIHHALAPGGVYIIEDLLTSGDGAYKDAPTSTVERLANLQRHMMLELHDSTPPPLEEDRALLRVIKRITCATGACALKTYEERDHLLNRRWPRG